MCLAKEEEEGKVPPSAAGEPAASPGPGHAAPLLTAWLPPGPGSPMFPYRQVFPPCQGEGFAKTAESQRECFRPSGRWAPERPAPGSGQLPAPPHLGRAHLPHPLTEITSRPQALLLPSRPEVVGVKKTDGYGTWPVLPRISVGLQHVGDSFCISEAPAGKQEAS